LEEVVNVLRRGHEGVGWLDFITGKLCPNLFLGCAVNRRDYRVARFVE
jgi:hypothetical protein